MTFYIGCAVWAYRGWVGEFYPSGSKAKDFLRLYSDRFTAVEGNTTFYSLPNPETVERWSQTMPAGFRFCPKLPRQFSHQGPLMPHLSKATQFMASLEPLGSRLGPVFLQLPPSYSPALRDDLQQFLSAWPRHRWPLAVEVRHLSWFQATQSQALNQSLTDLGVGRVLLDTRPIYEGIETPHEDPQLTSERRKPNVPLLPEVTANFAMVRYIGHPKMSRNQGYIKEWGLRLKQWLDQGKTIYLFAHCPEERQSPALARQLYHCLQQEGAQLPPLLWDQVVMATADASTVGQQLSLF